MTYQTTSPEECERIARFLKKIKYGRTIAAIGYGLALGFIMRMPTTCLFLRKSKDRHFTSNRREDKTSHMTKVFRALKQALESCLDVRILFLLFVPFFVAMMIAVVLFFSVGTVWVTSLSGSVEQIGLFKYVSETWQLSEAVHAFSYVVAIVLIFLLVLPVGYLGAILLVSIFLMPILLKIIEQKEFYGLEKKTWWLFIRKRFEHDQGWYKLFSFAVFDFATLDFARDGHSDTDGFGSLILLIRKSFFMTCWSLLLRKRRWSFSKKVRSGPCTYWD